MPGDSKMASQKLTLRLAEGKDFLDVMSINRDVYEGYDYLSTVYYELLHDKDILMYLAEYESGVIGFIAFKIINQGCSAVSMATRMAKSAQGTGATIQFKSLALEQLKQRRPAVKNIVTAIPTGSFPNYWKKQLSDPVQKDNCLKKFEFLSFILEPFQISEALARYRREKALASGVTIPKVNNHHTDSDINDMISVLHKESRFFMHDYWLIDAVEDKSVRHVLRSSNTLLSRDSKGQIVSFSTHAGLTVKFGYRSDLWYHGRDLEDALNHTMGFLQCLENKSFHGWQKAYLILSYPMGIGSTEGRSMEDVLLPYIGPRNAVKPTFPSTLGIIWKDDV